MSDGQKPEEYWFWNFLGSPEESRRILDWGYSNCHELWEECVSSLEGEVYDMLGCAVLLGKICRKFEEAEGLAPRAFKANSAEEEYQIAMLKHIVDDNRFIVGVYSDDEPDVGGSGERLLEFAYTIGNHYDTVNTPELLCFYPSQSTQTFLLNRVSDALSSGSIKPLQPEETVLIEGVLGAAKQHPIRLRLLTNEERSESKQKWTCQLYLSVPLILVEVPDTDGYFADEKGAAQYLTKVTPEDLISPSVTRSVEGFSGPPEIPLDERAIYDCLRYLNACFPASDNPEEESDPDVRFVSWATKTVILECIDDLDPEFLSDDLEPVMSQLISSLQVCTSAKYLKNLIVDRLNELEDAGDYNRWFIEYPQEIEPLSEGSFEVKFESVQDLLSGVDWQFVSRTVEIAYRDSVNKQELERIRIRLAEMSELNQV